MSYKCNEIEIGNFCLRVLYLQEKRLSEAVIKKTLQIACAWPNEQEGCGCDTCQTYMFTQQTHVRLCACLYVCLSVCLSVYTITKKIMVST